MDKKKKTNSKKHKSPHFNFVTAHPGTKQFKPLPSRQIINNGCALLPSLKVGTHNFHESQYIYASRHKIDFCNQSLFDNDAENELIRMN